MGQLDPLLPLVTSIVFIQHFLRDSLQHLFGENTQQLPPNVQGLKHCPVVIQTWEGGMEGRGREEGKEEQRAEDEERDRRGRGENGEREREREFRVGRRGRTGNKEEERRERFEERRGRKKRESERSRGGKGPVDNGETMVKNNSDSGVTESSLGHPNIWSNWQLNIGLWLYTIWTLADPG